MHTIGPKLRGDLNNLGDVWQDLERIQSKGGQRCEAKEIVVPSGSKKTVDLLHLWVEEVQIPESQELATESDQSHPSHISRD